MTKTINLLCDGLCEPRNPGGFACWAWAAIGEDGSELDSGRGCIGQGIGMSSNVAEYQAVIEVLTWAASNAQGKRVEVFTDSQLVVSQVNREWACKAEHLRPLRDVAIALMSQTRAVLRWIPREQNARADLLSRIAYREARAEAKGGLSVA